MGVAIDHSWKEFDTIFARFNVMWFFKKLKHSNIFIDDF